MARNRANKKARTPQITASAPTTSPVASTTARKRSADENPDDDGGDGNTSDEDVQAALAVMGEGKKRKPARGSNSKRAKRRKTDEVMGEVMGEVAFDEELRGGDRTSATLEAVDGMEGEEVVTLVKEEEEVPALSKAQRRALKGKGKATEDDDVKPVLPTLDPTIVSENQRLEKELSFKNSMLLRQTEFLAALKSTVACMICLETLDRPYSLKCGHVFCRKCLITWFHRPDSEAAGAAMNGFHPDSDDSDDSEDSDGSDILLGAGVPVPRATSDSDSSSDGSSDSEEEDGAHPREVLRASFGGRSVDLTPARGSTSDAVWNTMAGEFDRVAANFFASSTSAAPQARITSLEANEEDPSNPQNIVALRAARLNRFGGSNLPTSASGSTYTNAQSGPSNSTSTTAAPRASTSTSARVIADPTSRHQVSAAATSAAAPRRARSPPIPVSRAHSPETPPLPPFVSPSPAPAPAPPHHPPVGAHRKTNLVCPQCRDVVDSAPFRIFVLSETVALVRQAELDGLLDGTLGGTAPPGEVDDEQARKDKVKTDALPGMDDADVTFGGLFATKEEMEKEKKKKSVAVMRDVEDGVRRCHSCNWEIDEESGVCEGCGELWDLSDDNDSDGAPPDFLLFGGAQYGNQYDQDRSDDDDEMDDEENDFIDDGPLSDDEGMGFDDERDGNGSDSMDSMAPSDDFVVPSRRRRVVDSPVEEQTDEESTPSSESEEVPRSRRRIVVIDDSEEEIEKSSDVGVAVVDTDDESDESKAGAGGVIEAGVEEEDSDDEDSD